MQSIKREYKIAYVEVLEIIKNMPTEIRKKIPQEAIKILEENKDKNYNFSYNKNLEPEEQNITEGAKATLVYLYQKYIK